MPNNLIWGFHRLEDIAAQRVVDNIDAVRDAITEANQNQNQLTNEIFAFLAERTTESQTKYKMPAAFMELQPLTELGRGLPQRYRELEYTVGFPIQKAGLPIGSTYEQRQKMNIRQFAGLTEAVQIADTRWIRRHVLAGLFYNGAGWIHDDPDDDAGEITVKGLANGDSQVYVKESAELGATDNHYLAQAGDLLTASDPIPAIVEELREHPTNTGDVVILGSYQDRAKYTGLAEFYPEPDRNLRPGTGTVEFTGNAPGGVPGEFLGYHEANVYIFLWRGIPQNYMVATTTGGLSKPLRMREHPESTLQGFRPDADREDYPFFETHYVRRAGFGGYNRVGAVVQQFNSATYGVPAGYGSPLG